MKTILSGVIISLFISVSVQGQNFDQWTDPIPLTDSLTDNTNPFLIRFDYPLKVMMVWEKCTDSISTSIYLDDILDETPCQQILSDPGIHYTHPKIIYMDSYPQSDTLFFLFYETNQNGNKDIYFLAFINDSTYLTPEPFANSPNDEEQVAVDRYDWYYKNTDYQIHLICWISEGNLFARNLMSDGQVYFFDDEVLIDSNGCSEPSIDGQGQLFYTKEDSTGYSIYMSTCDNVGTWSSPEIVYNIANAMNPTSSLHYNVPCWTTYIDSSWTVMMDYPGTVYNIASDDPLNPAVTGVIWSEPNEQEVFIAVTFPENDIDEIFMTTAPLSLNFANFTNSNTMNQNPQFFLGEYEGFYYHWWNYLIWESFRNGHWQIWSSKVFMGFSHTNEYDEDNKKISTHPNPFTHETTLEFTLDSRSDVVIEVYNSRGMQVATVANQSFDQGEHQLRWSSDGLAAGIYIIKMTVSDMIYTAKLVKSP